MGKLIKSFNAGRIKASVWTNSKEYNGKILEYDSIKFSKAYKPEDASDWNYTDSFSVEDLPKIALLAQEVYRSLKMKAFHNENTDLLGGKSDGTANE